MSSRVRSRVRFVVCLTALVVGATACPPPPGDPGSTNTTTTSTNSTTSTSLPSGPCPVGTFNSVDGNAPCTPAFPGTYVDTVGATNATFCGLGTYQPSSGQASCFLAPVGSYVDTTAAVAPTPCPIGTTTSSSGAMSASACQSTSTTTTTTAPVDPPVISSFAAVTPSGGAPVTTALTWSISDPLSRPLTCSLDLDHDGTFDRVVNGCTSASTRAATFDEGTNIVTLRVSNGDSSAEATATVSVAPSGSDPFDITLRLSPTLSPAAASLVEEAAARWEAVVRRGLPSASASIAPGTFEASNPGLAGVVDDLFIDVFSVPADGVGGQVATGGAAQVRADGTSVYGVVTLDADDVSDLLVNDPQLLRDTIIHEMGHVLTDQSARLSLILDPFTSHPAFTGSAARAAFQELGGNGPLPMSGTGHWSEPVFGSELMTPIAAPGVHAPLSMVTIAALADQGYGVTLVAADPYSLPTP